MPAHPAALSAFYHTPKLLAYLARLAILGTLVNLCLSCLLLLLPLNPSLAYLLTSNLASVFSPAHHPTFLPTRISETLWGWMQHVFTVENNAQIIFHGDDVIQGESAVVIANHQVYADYYTVHAVAKRAGMLGELRYFAKDSLKWLPLFGWSLWASGMILVKRNWTHDERLVKRAFRRIKDQKPPIWIVSYPEGTRRTDAKIASSQAFCRKLGNPQLQEVLWPRTKGFVATVSELRQGCVKFVYDLTIIYDGPLGFNVPPSLLLLHSTPDLSAAGWKFHVHIRRTRIVDLPRNESALARWLEDAFVRKDGMMSMLRSQGPIGATELSVRTLLDKDGVKKKV